MTQCTADFEAGVLGATIATTDPGSLTPWDSVTTGPANTITYDTTNVAHGLLCSKHFQPAVVGCTVTAVGIASNETAAQASSNTILVLPVGALQTLPPIVRGGFA